MRIDRRALALVCALSLGACGDGGGGASGPALAPAAAVVITEANAKPVAADALQNVQNTSASQAGGALATGTQVSVASAMGTVAVARAVRALAGLIAPLQVQLASGVVASRTCNLGGMLTVSGNVASSAGLSAGDNFTLVADNCRLSLDGRVAIMNGTMAITVSSGSLTAVPFHVALVMTFRNFSLEAEGIFVALNGEMRLDWSATSDSVQSMTGAGSSISNTVRSGVTTRTVTWKNYMQTISIDTSAVQTTLSATIETNNPRLGTAVVSYQLSTPAAFTSDLAGNITAGSIRVLGANSSSLVLTVTSSNSFNLQVDANGDGTYEATLSTTLAALQALQ